VILWARSGCYFRGGGERREDAAERGVEVEGEESDGDFDAVKAAGVAMEGDSGPDGVVEEEERKGEVEAQKASRNGANEGVAVMRKMRRWRWRWRLQRWRLQRWRWRFLPGENANEERRSGMQSSSDLAAAAAAIANAERGRRRSSRGRRRREEEEAERVHVLQQLHAESP
jgi:hypothetical protein